MKHKPTLGQQSQVKVRSNKKEDQIKFILLLRSDVREVPISPLNYLAGPYITGPKLTPAPSTPAFIGVIFQMFTVKLS